MDSVTLLATPEGRWLHADSARFFALLGETAPDYDGVLFAVKNLGFIALRMRLGLPVEIVLHPHNAAPNALAVVFRMLRGSRLQPVRIRHLQTAWQQETVWSPEEAISRLRELCRLPASRVAQPSRRLATNARPQTRAPKRRTSAPGDDQKVPSTGNE
jgi:hypothetical protein